MEFLATRAVEDDGVASKAMRAKQTTTDEGLATLGFGETFDGVLKLVTKQSLEQFQQSILAQQSTRTRARSVAAALTLLAGLVTEASSCKVLITCYVFLRSSGSVDCAMHFVVRSLLASCGYTLGLKFMQCASTETVHFQFVAKCA